MYGYGLLALNSPIMNKKYIHTPRAQRLCFAETRVWIFGGFFLRLQ